MTILSDHWILHQATYHDLINPFLSYSESKLEGKPTTSYGLSSFGYDIRLGDSFVLFNKTTTENTNQFIVNHHHGTVPTIVNYVYVKGDRFTLPKVIDPVNFHKDLTTKFENVESLVLPPGGFCLGVSKEKLKLPRDISAICMQKSTLARVGLECIITPLEAGWTGYITLELYNKSPMPVLLKAGMGICQVQFFQGDQPCRVSYGDRNGKYQNQPSTPVLPRRKL